ncbi:MAG: GNAT family N-acetyltransferase [Hyphomicrobiales bacterium]|nr:GNAT family N-acetyltransferase [Hyphomicrobiales bacterium]MCP4998965.1 GNAT family N-acetyltransferase [Hyphomicrobiales bacterium]
MNGTAETTGHRTIRFDGKCGLASSWGRFVVNHPEGDWMIEIRNAVAQDAQQIARVGILAWENIIASCGGDIAKIRDNAHATYQDFSANYWDRILIACVNGAIVGWGAREELVFKISYLWIDPEHHRKSVGTALLEALERDVEADGFGYVELETHARSASAIAFFKNSGYRIISNSLKYSTSLQQDIEKVTMRKELAGIV